MARSLNLCHLSPTSHWKVVAPPPRNSTERSGSWILGSFVLRDLKETQWLNNGDHFYWRYLSHPWGAFLLYHSSYCCLPQLWSKLCVHAAWFISQNIYTMEPLVIVYPSIHPSIHPSTWDRVVATELIAAPAGRRRASGWWADRKRTCESFPCGGKQHGWVFFW